MYINAICLSANNLRKYIKGIPEKAETIVTTYGRYKNFHIAIDNYKNSENATIQKRYVIWNNEIQLIRYKDKNKDGRFDFLV